MKKRTFAVCDLEASYAYNLMEYMNDKNKTPFEVQAFTSVDSFKLFALKNPVEVLLISQKAMTEELSDLEIGRIIILSEGEILPEHSEYPAIYKYQSSAQVISEVMNFYAGEDLTVPPVAVLKKKVDIIGVYSPIKRTLKTSFALTLGQILAKDRGVLYLNMEEFSGFESLMGKKFQADLSDLVYYMRQGKKNLIYKINSVIQSVRNLDYIPPSPSPGDLKSITFAEWNLLLDEIINYSTYETIILDLSECVDDLFQMLAKCTKIYMPVREDSVSTAKLEQYENLLKMQEQEETIKRTEKLKLPYHGSFGAKEHYVDQLLWGELGDYVRGLV